MENNESIMTPIDINGDIEFNNVHFAYRARKDAVVLQNLNLTARAGKTTAIVGPSGCGELIYQHQVSL